MVELKSYFKTNDNILLAYLFGSRVSGAIGAMSDYDIGIYVRTIPQFQEKFEIELKLRKLLHTIALDLVIMNEAPLALNNNIIRGRCIYAVDRHQRTELEADILSRYFDYLPVLKRHNQDILRTVQDEQQLQRNRVAFAKTEKLLAEIRTVAGQNAK